VHGEINGSNLDIPFSGLVRIQYHRNRTVQVKKRMRNFIKTVANSKT
jgi:hypothetical protein